MPPEDNSRVSLSIEPPPGAVLEDTERTTAICNRIKDIDGVGNVFVLGGASSSGDLELRRAAAAVLLGKRDHSLVNTVVMTRPPPSRGSRAAGRRGLPPAARPAVAVTAWRLRRGGYGVASAARAACRMAVSAGTTARPSLPRAKFR